MAGAKDAAEAKLAMDKPLSETEEKRLRRFRRSTENRRGRTNPAIVPSKLARTSAFVPRRHGLSADGSFESVYVVRPHTVVHVHGRELGSQHRDAIYAIFRSRARKVSEPNIAYVLGSKDPLTAFPRVEYYYAQTTWRDLLLTTGRTAHVNNLGSLLRCFEEVRSVSFRVYQGSYAEYEAQVARGRLPGAGFSDNLINEIKWDGVSLDSQVSVKYGAWVRQTFEAKNLVSLNADVYFRLKSDYAKSFWPFIDSQPTYTYVDETVRKVGVIRPRAETAGGPNARRRHSPGRACRSRRRSELSASNVRPSETSAFAAEHSFGDAAAIAPCSR